MPNLPMASLKAAASRKAMHGTSFQFFRLAPRSRSFARSLTRPLDLICFSRLSYRPLARTVRSAHRMLQRPSLPDLQRIAACQLPRR